MFDPMSTEADLAACYRLLLGRLPDEGGWRHYRAALPDTELRLLVEMFLCSEEFRGSEMYATLLGHSGEAPLERVHIDGRIMYLDSADHLVRPLLHGGG